MNFTVMPEVKQALEHNQPVVALESTLITHGLPRPENGRVGAWLESECRESGAIPATIAVLEGTPNVGLDSVTLARLAAMTTPRKCSLRDIPIAMARGESGGTTVAATMFLAHRAGIKVFATGGIGGVHRGHPFDVSNDLTALGTIPMTVVCAGAKAILDLPLTLEVLETNGVTVVGYQTDELPAFYYRKTGYPIDVRCDTAEEIAHIVRRRDEAGLHQSILVVNPVPDQDSMDAAEAERAIEAALKDAERAHITGKNVTPYLLEKVSALTDARSMKANLSLLANNVRLAAAIARCLSGH